MRIRLFLIALLFLIIIGCKGDKIEGNPKELNSPDEISKVLVIPDAERIEGPPPSGSANNGHVTLTNQTPEISGISGENMIVSYKYQYATPTTEPIKYLILYIEGASSYFKIPIKTVGQSGTLQIPVKIPSGYSIPYDNQGVKKCEIRLGRCTVNGSNSCYNDPTCIKGVGLPPKAGTGKSTIDGTAYDATALCDLEYGDYGKGYAIMMGTDKIIILYNLGQGSFQLNNFENIDDPFENRTPVALFFDASSGSFYYSISGYATVKGKVVSVNMVMKDLDGYVKQISAIGNCK